jgi:hypothetical protein
MSHTTTEKTMEEVRAGAERAMSIGERGADGIRVGPAPEEYDLAQHLNDIADREFYSYSQGTLKIIGNTNTLIQAYKQAVDWVEMRVKHIKRTRSVADGTTAMCFISWNVICKAGPEDAYGKLMERFETDARKKLKGENIHLASITNRGMESGKQFHTFTFMWLR